MDGIGAKWRQARAHLDVLPKVARLVWASAKGWTCLWAAVLVINGVLPIWLMRLIKNLIDELGAAGRASYSWQSVRPAVVTGVLMGASVLLMELLQGVLEWLRTMQVELLQDRICGLVQQKTAEVDLEFYESPACYDQLYRARDEAETRPPALLDSMGSILQNGISLIVLAAVMASYSGWLLVAMFLSLVPAFSIVMRYNWLSHVWWRGTTAERRWIQYYDQKFTSAPVAQEMRLFRLGDGFSKAYQSLREKLRKERLVLIERQTGARMLAASAGLVISGGAVGWMAWRMLRGMATLGDLAFFYQAFAGGQNLVRLLTGSLGQALTSVLHLGELFEFLELKPKIIDPPQPTPAPTVLVEGVRFENVRFRYPDSEREALQDLSLSIPAGKVVAVVGPNGAGKSTLVKLLCRFYDPSAGRITIDGIDLRKMVVDEVRGLSSVLFQLPVSYDATAEENIALGRSASMDRDSVLSAARAAGAHDVISRLPQGYATRLGKSFAEGNELSAGEWQRVAMARAFYRDTPLVLLDEPTSFMDPWAEGDWFARLRKFAQGRTAMVVTHRFTIAMRADLIHVLDAGRVVESGTHEQLLERNGLYARSWKDQMGAQATEAPESGDAVFGESVNSGLWVDSAFNLLAPK
jgi:ATP-binding cassette subfamily B protein